MGQGLRFRALGQGLGFWNLGFDVREVEKPNCVEVETRLSYLYCNREPYYYLYVHITYNIRI